MINVRELIQDKDFAAEYTVERSYWEWRLGRFVSVQSERLTFRGAVQPAGPKELQQFPEGDRQSGVLKFFCRPPGRLFITNDKPQDRNGGVISDVIIFDNARWRVTQVTDWRHNGYMRAFGVLMGGGETGG